jgi:hypothetical protein
MALQRRILMDVLSFFYENNYLKSEKLTSTFNRICILLCSHLSWQEDQSANAADSHLEYVNTLLFCNGHISIDWSRVLRVPTEKELIQLLINVILQSRRQPTNTSLETHNFLPRKYHIPVFFSYFQYLLCSIAFRINFAALFCII